MPSNPPQKQTMLLSKRIATFLEHNRSPYLHTLILLTPTGKLLSTSSASPASVLRRQGTLAVSLWALYSPFPSQTVSEALPPDDASSNGIKPRETKSILIQTELGIMVIRMLACGLLFVTIGPVSVVSGTTTPPTTTPPTTTPPTTTTAALTPIPQTQREDSMTISPPGSPDGGVEGEIIKNGEGSEAASLRSARGGGVGIMGMKRRAEELGSWLEGALDGLVLNTAER